MSWNEPGRWVEQPSYRIFTLLLMVALMLSPGVANAEDQNDHKHHSIPPPLADRPSEEVAELRIPNVRVVDQDGRELHFYDDLIQGRKVVMNFIFTTCTTICPPMGANFAKLRRLLDENPRDLSLLSVSVDPRVDTPSRLQAWRGRFGVEDGWTLVTGAKPEVDRLLKALGVFTANKWDHAPFVLIGDGGGAWQRVYGLSEPSKILAALDDLGQGQEVPAESRTVSQVPPESSVPSVSQVPPKSSAALSTGGQRYFTDVKLVDQNGKKRRLYSDLLQNKVVVIHSFFGTCQGSCPVMLKTFQQIQARLGDRVGQDVHLLSISVDPGIDTSERLAALATALGARPGWYFLTGPQQDVDFALHKFGQRVAQRESHSNIFIIGNEPTGLWKKAFGLSSGEEIVKIVEGVLADQG